MATIGKAAALELIRNGGHYLDDPLPHSIWRYVNDWGKPSYSVCYDQRAALSLQRSPSCNDAVLLWDIHGWTGAGEQEIGEEAADLTV